MKERQTEQDPAKIRRENLLNIYKEKPDEQETAASEPDLSKGIKFKYDDTEAEAASFSETSVSKRPLIQELAPKTS